MDLNNPLEIVMHCLLIRGMIIENTRITSFSILGSTRMHASILGFSKFIKAETYDFKNHINIKI